MRELENYLQRALILSPGPELNLPELPRGALAPAPAPPISPGTPGPPGRFVDEVRSLIERALAATGGRIYGPQGAAALLGLKPTTLQGKMAKYRIAVPIDPSGAAPGPDGANGPGAGPGTGPDAEGRPGRNRGALSFSRRPREPGVGKDLRA